MIPRTAAEAADLQRCRERQAAVARQLAKHHAAMQQRWTEQADRFDAEARHLAAGRTALAKSQEQGRE